MRDPSDPRNVPGWAPERAERLLASLRGAVPPPPPEPTLTALARVAPEPPPREREAPPIVVAPSVRLPRGVLEALEDDAKEAAAELGAALAGVFWDVRSEPFGGESVMGPDCERLERSRLALVELGRRVAPLWGDADEAQRRRLVALSDLSRWASTMRAPCEGAIQVARAFAGAQEVSHARR